MKMYFPCENLFKYIAELSQCFLIYKVEAIGFVINQEVLS
ncbi:MAG: hypothetical protein V7606_4182 [Burkholderiales bacterium]|jgi:hypothetical protein|nr:hypothetical protein [Burkholderia sp.]